MAACITPGSDLVVEHVYVGPGRAGFLDVLGRMGAGVERRGASDPATHTADHPGPLRPAARPPRSAASEVPGLIDEIPVLAVAAAAAEGTTIFATPPSCGSRRATGSRPSPRGSVALGVAVEARPDGLAVVGTAAAGRWPAVGGRLPRRPPHRHGHGGGRAWRPTVTRRIAGWEAVATSYPSFEEDLRRCVS